MHGSLKPSNILINNKGEAVLSDFSLAKPAAVGAKNTQLNPQINVFRYQSPEVISDEPISKASDVYSWAMTALEIITGGPSFECLPNPRPFTSLTDPFRTPVSHLARPRTTHSAHFRE